MQKLLLATALVMGLSMMVDTADARPSARRTVRAAQNLARVARDLSRYSWQRGYQQTSRKLGYIAEAGDDVERAARRGRLGDAQDAVNDAIDTLIDMRPNVNAIPSGRDRWVIKRDITNAINRVGDEVFENNFIPGSGYSAQPGRQLTEEQQVEADFGQVRNLDATGGQFEDDLDGSGGGDGGGAGSSDGFGGQSGGNGGFDP